MGYIEDLLSKINFSRTIVKNNLKMEIQVTKNISLVEIDDTEFSIFS